MYCISLLDRNNLAIARSANGNVMNRQLQLDKGNHYSVVALVFFITYIILEIPVSPALCFVNLFLSAPKHLGATSGFTG